MSEIPRKQILCDRPGQWRYIRRILYLEVLVALVCVPMTAFMTLFLMFSEMYVSSSQFWTTTLLSMVVLCLILAGILVFLGARLSNRIYGPVYRMNQVFRKAVEEGNLPAEFRIRSHDEFQQLAQQLNDFLGRMRRQDETFTQVRQQLEAEVDRLKELLEQPDGFDKTRMVQEGISRLEKILMSAG